MIKNPWVDLPVGAPFVLPSDRLPIDVFNRTAQDGNRLHVDSAPEPFFGPIDARIVILLLNAGVGDEEAMEAQILSSIQSGESQDAHLFIANGQRWWRTLVAPLLEHSSVYEVARSILSVEYFPYRSRSFGCGHVRLPSQEFSFELVRSAIRRRSTIVIARGTKLWLGAVPELEGKFITIRNPRKASLSQKNLGSEAYDSVCAQLKHESQRH